MLVSVPIQEPEIVSKIVCYAMNFGGKEDGRSSGDCLSVANLLCSNSILPLSDREKDRRTFKIVRATHSGIGSRGNEMTISWQLRR